MTFISTATTGSSVYNSPTLTAGDIVVLAVGGDRAAGGIPTPSGWSLAAGPLDQVCPAGGGATGYAQTTNAVFWRRSTGTSLTASFGRSLTIQSVVLRGPTAIAGADARRVNAATLTYPGLSFSSPMTGHVVHVGIATEDLTSGPAASGDTVRQSALVRATGVRNLSGAPVDRNSWLTTGEKSFTSATSVAAASSGQRVDGWAVTLAFATVSGPDAPTVTAPLAGSVDLAAGFTIAWTPSWAQTGYAIRRKQGAGAYQWWNGADWSASSETIITSTTQTVTVPAAQFVNAGTTYTLEVATVGDALRPSLGLYAPVTVVGKAPPTLSSAVVSTLSGTDVTTLPTVTLSGAAGSGGTLTGYRVKVDQDLGAGWVKVLDSGVTSSPWSVTVPQSTSLTNGSPIRFRSTAVQDGVQESAVITSPTYTLAMPTPAAPILSWEQVTHPDSGLPGIDVTVTSLPSGTDYTVTLYRDGVKLGDYPTTGAVTLSDYSPDSGAVVYSATLTMGDGVTTVRKVSPAGFASPVTLARVGQWLWDALDPSAAVRVYLQTEGERSHGTRTQKYQPLGQSGWLVHSGGRVDYTSQATVATTNPTELDAALGLLTSGRVLALSMMPERDGLGGLHDVPNLRFRVTGDVSEARIVQKAIAWRALSFDFIPDRSAP